MLVDYFKYFLYFVMMNGNKKFKNYNF